MYLDIVIILVIKRVNLEIVENWMEEVTWFEDLIVWCRFNLILRPLVRRTRRVWLVCPSPYIPGEIIGEEGSTLEGLPNLRWTDGRLLEFFISKKKKKKK